MSKLSIKGFRLLFENNGATAIQIDDIYNKGASYISTSCDFVETESGLVFRIRFLLPVSAGMFKEVEKDFVLIHRDNMITFEGVEEDNTRTQFLLVKHVFYSHPDKKFNNLRRLDEKF